MSITRDKVCNECGRNYHYSYDCCGIELEYSRERFCSDFCERMHKQGPEIISAIETLLSKLDENDKTLLANLLCPSREVTEENEDESWVDNYCIGEFVGESPFEEDLVRDILINRFGGNFGIQTWGLW